MFPKQLAITTPDGDLAGDMIQSIAEFLSIEVRVGMKRAIYVYIYMYCGSDR